MKRNPVGGSGRGVVIGQEERARVRKKSGVLMKKKKKKKQRKGAVDRLGTAQYMRN